MIGKLINLQESLHQSRGPCSGGTLFLEETVCPFGCLLALVDQYM